MVDVISRVPQRHILRLSMLDTFSDGREDKQGMIQPVFLVIGPTCCAASDQHKASGEGLHLFSGRQNWVQGLRMSQVIPYQCQMCILQSSFLL